MPKRRKAFVVILALSALAATTRPLLAQAVQPEPVLVLNSQWNLAYAKSACKSAEIWYRAVGKTAEKLGCENFASCPKMLAAVKACRARGAVAALRDFEQRLTGALTADPGCGGIEVVRYSGPGDAVYETFARLRHSADFWTLFVDFSPGAAKQSWRLQQRTKSASGDDEPQAIVSQACALMLGRGAKAD